MKMHQDSGHSSPKISQYGDGFIEVNERRFTNCLIISGQSVSENEKLLSIEDLTPETVAEALHHIPEILLLGTGSQQKFLPPNKMRPFLKQGLSFDTMDTGAACRTYNILIAEGRDVAAILFTP